MTTPRDGSFRRAARAGTSTTTAPDGRDQTVQGGPTGCTAADLGRALGVSEQAAGKHLEGLERLGYLTRGHDPHDARRKTYALTARAIEVLDESERAFDRIRRRWARELGEQRLAAIEDDLRRIVPGELFRLDTPHWFGT